MIHLMHVFTAIASWCGHMFKQDDAMLIWMNVLDQLSVGYKSVGVCHSGFEIREQECISFVPDRPLMV
jgi:hypothetical protein